MPWVPTEGATCTCSCGNYLDLARPPNELMPVVDGRSSPSSKRDKELGSQVYGNESKRLFLYACLPFCISTFVISTSVVEDTDTAHFTAKAAEFVPSVPCRRHTTTDSSCDSQIDRLMRPAGMVG